MPACDPPPHDALRQGHDEARAEAGDLSVDAIADRREAIYLYCLARRSHASPRARVLQADLTYEYASSSPSHDDRRVMLIPFGDVLAVVSVVNRDDFCGPAAEGLMKDLAWVAPRASHHERVVEAVMRTSPVVPARFGTLFSSRERLVAWLATQHAAITRALDQLAGHEEWAVRGRLNRPAAEAVLVAAAARTPRSMSPGARYLEERRIRAGIGQDLTTWLQTVREQIVEHLFAHAAAFRERAVSVGALEGEGIPVLNWAFLVQAERVEPFRACVQQIGASHAEYGLALDHSGPWPPYSFSPTLASDRGDDVPDAERS